MDKIWQTYISRFEKPHEPEVTEFYTQLGDEYKSNLPYLFDVESFCVSLLYAKLTNQKICIYSDYDTDAVTATATMYWGLLELGFKNENLSYYAPDRFTEGYGMNPEAIEDLAWKNDLIISVDCGINSVLEAKKVLEVSQEKLNKNLNAVSLIITDHHHIQNQLPECDGVINPRVAQYVSSEEVSRKNLWDQRTTQINNKLLRLNELGLINQKFLKYVQNWCLSLYAQNKSNSLSTSVTGVGVAWFALVWLGYVFKEWGLANEELNMASFNPTSLNKLLPFVAIGTIADCQSVLQPTNRLLVRAGISSLQKLQTEFEGLSQLLQLSGLSEKIGSGYKLSSQDLGFVLSPILNSSGRVSHANLSISVLVQKDTQLSKELAQKLVATNQTRKEMVKDILMDVESQAKAQYEDSQPLIWLQGNWSKGIVGLLASRLVNQYNIPVVVVSMEEGEAVASLRAPEGFHLPKALEEVKTHLIKFGGHPGAAGFSSLENSLSKVEVALKKSILKQRENFVRSKSSFIPEEIYTKAPNDIQRVSSQKQFLWVDWPQLNSDVLSQIWYLDPFGQDFPFPEIAFEVSKKTVEIRWISDQKHLKLIFPNGLSATAFNVSTDLVNRLLDTKSDSIWCVAKISQNAWKNKTTNELIIQIIKVEL